MLLTGNPRMRPQQPLHNLLRVHLLLLRVANLRRELFYVPFYVVLLRLQLLQFGFQFLAFRVVLRKLFLELVHHSRFLFLLQFFPVQFRLHLVQLLLQLLQNPRCLFRLLLLFLEVSLEVLGSGFRAPDDREQLFALALLRFHQLADVGYLLAVLSLLFLPTRGLVLLLGFQPLYGGGKLLLLPLVVRKEFLGFLLLRLLGIQIDLPPPEVRHLHFDEDSLERFRVDALTS
mmetsp:Transcript_5852/g.14559  ORF Transcript_5852/g.14559 Transcript_5852/m.14559 type:complete len:231 (-) Transcript_5852:1354-2046(-)